MVLPQLRRQVLFGDPQGIGTKLSPDGSHLAWLAPRNGVANIWVSRVDEPNTAHCVTNERSQGILLFEWSYVSGCIVFVRDPAADENFHVFAVTLDDGISRDLTPFEGTQAMIKKISKERPNEILVEINRRDPRFFDLHKIQIQTGASEMIAKNEGFLNIIVDELLCPRIAVRGLQDGGREILRADDAGRWHPFLAFTPEDARISMPSHLSADGNVLYLHDSRERDTAALVAINVRTLEKRILVASDEVDVGDLILDHATFVPLAAKFEREQPHWEAIEPRVIADLEFLAKAVPKAWYLTSQSRDGRLWTITAETDTRPTVEFLYERDTRRLIPLHESYPGLVNANLHPMTPVTIPARDGLPLVSYLTRPSFKGENNSPPPLVICVHGGPWSRDRFGFNILHQWLADRGYAALGVNYRGSTGFGKAFTNAGDGEWGNRMNDDIADAARWAIAHGEADPARIGIFGGSYGGYASLMALAREPDLFQCAVDVVGPTNLETFLGAIPPYWETIRGELERAIGNPSTQEGKRRLRERSPLVQAHRIRGPLLIMHGARDPRVKQEESDSLVAALESSGVQVTYVTYSDEGHGFQRADNRISFFAVAEAFLSRHLGGGLEPLSPVDARNSSIVFRKDPLGLAALLGDHTDVHGFQ